MNSLENDLYFAALSLSLTLPDICGMMMYPDLYSKKRYIKWYDEYIGKYEESPSNKDRTEKMPFLDGDACYELRCAINPCRLFLHRSLIFDKKHVRR